MAGWCGAKNPYRRLYTRGNGVYTEAMETEIAQALIARQLELTVTAFAQRMDSDVAREWWKMQTATLERMVAGRELAAYVG